MLPPPVAGSGNVVALRATAITEAPASAATVAIPRPNPLLAPTTIVLVPDRSFILFSLIVSRAPAPPVPPRAVLRTDVPAPLPGCSPSPGQGIATSDRGRCPVRRGPARRTRPRPRTAELPSVCRAPGSDRCLPGRSRPHEPAPLGEPGRRAVTG